MDKFYYLRWIALLILISPVSFAKLHYRQNFLQPMFHGERVNYCMIGKGGCGDAVAQKYCHIMGFKRSDKYTKANNVGLTNYLDSHWQCKGWQCHGFSQIRCINDQDHPPAKSYHYRYKRFAYPRVSNYRLAWCFQSHKGCGYRAAYAFCRYQGYMKVKHYEKQANIAATRTIGDKKLCFGDNCHSFKSIQCQR